MFGCSLASATTAAAAASAAGGVTEEAVAEARFCPAASTTALESSGWNDGERSDSNGISRNFPLACCCGVQPATLPTPMLFASELSVSRLVQRPAGSEFRLPPGDPAELRKSSSSLSLCRNCWLSTSLVDEDADDCPPAAGAITGVGSDAPQMLAAACSASEDCGDCRPVDVFSMDDCETSGDSGAGFTNCDAGSNNSGERSTDSGTASTSSDCAGSDDFGERSNLVVDSIGSGNVFL